MLCPHGMCSRCVTRRLLVSHAWKHCCCVGGTVLLRTHASHFSRAGSGRTAMYRRQYGRDSWPRLPGFVTAGLQAVQLPSPTTTSLTLPLPLPLAQITLMRLVWHPPYHHLPQSSPTCHSSCTSYKKRYQLQKPHSQQHASPQPCHTSSRH